MPFTTPEDIKALWTESKPLPSDEKLEAFITFVEGQVNREFGASTVVEWIADGDLELSYYTTVVSFIIIEYLQTGGKPFSAESQSYAGAASRSVTYNTSRARTDLMLSPADFARIKPKVISHSTYFATMAPQKTQFSGNGPYYGSGWSNDSYAGAVDGVDEDGTIIL